MFSIIDQSAGNLNLDEGAVLHQYESPEDAFRDDEKAEVSNAPSAGPKA